MSVTNHLLSNETLEEQMVWQPIIFDRTCPDDAKQIDALIETGQVWRVYDTLTEQIHDLIQTRHPQRTLNPNELAAKIPEITNGIPLSDYGRWVYYPWSGRLVHILPPPEFHALRLDRNREKNNPRGTTTPVSIHDRHCRTLCG